jgi:hypothetical protein
MALATFGKVIGGLEEDGTLDVVGPDNDALFCLACPGFVSRAPAAGWLL